MTLPAPNLPGSRASTGKGWLGLPASLTTIPHSQRNWQVQKTCVRNSARPGVALTLHAPEIVLATQLRSARSADVTDVGIRDSLLSRCDLRDRISVVIRRFLNVARSLGRPGVAGRTFKAMPDDTFLVSYPKSGNTWTRFLIANLLHPHHPVTLVTADRLIPGVDGHSQGQLDQLPRPRIIKSHYPFDPRYKHVIYVVRDPRDVVLSQYHYQRKRRVLPDDYPLESFVSHFLTGDVCPYGSWADNVCSWLATRMDDPGFLCIRYEDLTRDTELYVTKLARFLEVKPDLGLIRQAIDRSSVKRMRELEKTEAHLWESTKDTRKDISFLRNATSGEWRGKLPSSCAEEVESKWGYILRNLGYSTSSEDAQQNSWLPHLTPLTDPVQ